MQNNKEYKNKDDLLVNPSRRSSVSMVALKKVLRSRTRLLVCLATFPVYAIGIWLLLSSGRSIEGFMLVYMGLWSAFAFDMIYRKCPACNKQFFVRSILMTLRSKKCVHCGLDKDAITANKEKLSQII
ncbi:MAG TPA: hypothetical protein DCL66_00740 [Gammaproteobacteria bacterium]|nr:hypothetical protein [Gammaproteobacteria bacterium]